MLSGPVNIYAAITAGGGKWKDVAEVFAMPMLIGTVAVGAGMFAGNRLPAIPLRDWARLAITTTVALTTYAAVARVAMPAISKELIDLLRRLIARRRG